MKTIGVNPIEEPTMKTKTKQIQQPPPPKYLPKYRVSHDCSSSPGTLGEAATLEEAEQIIKDHMINYPSAEYFIYERMPRRYVKVSPILKVIMTTE